MKKGRTLQIDLQVLAAMYGFTGEVVGHIRMSADDKLKLVIEEVPDVRPSA